MNQEKTGKLISILRKEKKLTQEQLAEKMGVSINAVSKWERGLSFPDVSLLKKICKELDISIEELINGEKNNTEEAKEQAIISMLKSKNKVKKKLKITIIVSIILIIMSIIVCILSYLSYKDNFYYYSHNYYVSYATNDWYNRLLYINEKIPAGVTVYNTKEEAMAAFPKNYISTKPFLIKHKMYKDTIIESYIMFNKDGKNYYIRGGYKAGNISKSEIKKIEDHNKKSLLEAFGEDNCLIKDDGLPSCSGDYELANGKWSIHADDTGRVRAAGYDSFCVIDKHGGSGCGVTPQS